MSRASSQMATAGANGESGAVRRRGSSAVVEPSTWASVRWNRPAVSHSVGYRFSRFLGSLPSASSSFEPSMGAACRPTSPSPSSPRHRPSTNFGSTSVGGSSSADRYKRTSVLDTSPSARPEYFYLSSRTPARAALLDIRQNLRPVRKDNESKYARSKPSTSSSGAPLFTSVEAYSASYPTTSMSSVFTNLPGPTAAPSSAHVTAVKSAIVASSMAISNAMASQHRPIPKSERPWRQRLADAAQQRGKSAESAGTYSALSTTYPMSETASNILRGTRPYASGGKSGTLVALQQRKLQESAEHNLQEQLAELRNIVAEDKANSRYGRRADSSEVPSRRDSNASTYSIASRSSFADSTTSFGSALSCMPSSIRARQSALGGGSGAKSLYASSIHPPYVSTSISRQPFDFIKSYSPVRSSMVLQHVDELTDQTKTSNNELAPLAAMEESTLSNDSNKRNNINEATTPVEGGTMKHLSIINNNQYKSIKTGSANLSPNRAPARAGLSPSRTAVRTIKVETTEPSPISPTPINKEILTIPPAVEVSKPPKKRTVVKRVLKISTKRRESDAEKNKPTKLLAEPVNIKTPDMVCETKVTPQIIDNEIRLISEVPLDVKKTSPREKITTEIPARPTGRIGVSRHASKPTSPTKSQPGATPGEEERRYNAVTQFRPASAIRKKIPPPLPERSKTVDSAETTDSSTSSIAPVPGTWSLSNGDLYISHNRHLKRPSCVLNVEIICKHFLRENVAKSVLREASNSLVKKIRRMTTAIKPENKAVAANTIDHRKAAVATNYQKELPKPKKLANALAVLNCEFANKKRFRHGIQKIIRPYGFKMEKLSFKCNQSKLRLTILALNIVFRQQTRSAAVKILSSASNSQIARARASIRIPFIKMKRKSLTSVLKKENVECIVKIPHKIGKVQQRTSDKANDDTAKANKSAIEKPLSKDVTERNKKVDVDKNDTFKTTATESAAQQTVVPLGSRPSFVKNTHIPNVAASNQQLDVHKRSRTKDQIINYSVIPFVLPSELLLEEYVQRKRNELEKSASYALNANAFNDSVTLETLSQSSASASRGDSSPINAPITVQNYGNTRNNITHSKSASVATKDDKRLSTTDKNDGGKTPRITDEDLIENEKMIELLSYSNNTALLNNAVNKMERLLAPKVIPLAVTGDNNIRKMEQQNLPFSKLAKNLRKPVEVVKKLNVFDSPKSLFEEQMQNQAAQLKRTTESFAANPNCFSVVYEESADKTPKHNAMLAVNSAGDKQTVTQNFAASLASQQSRHQHERHAAHIPLSGRQSTTSLDSNNSGALDSASRSIDQMIDQARHRHHQQQNPSQNGKFKEAIDYLDQIFEDLRKECDIPLNTNKKQTSDKSAKPNNKIVRKENYDDTPDKKTNGENLINSRFIGKEIGRENIGNRTPPIYRNQCLRIRKSHFSCSRIIRTLPKNASRLQNQQQQNFINNGEKNFKKEKPTFPPSKENEQRKQQFQVDTQEQKEKQMSKKLHSDPSNNNNNLPTATSPKATVKKGKENRLDFTRKWLVNDSKLWDGEEQLPRPVKKNDSTDELSDGSEHSIGSCSAEVAAINIASEAKLGQKANGTTKTTTNNKSYSKPAKPTDSTAVKSQNTKVTTSSANKKKQSVTVVEPIRPQPYRPQPGSSDYDLHKMPSSDKLNGYRSSSQNRASSQDHCSMGSTHSQEGIKPTNSFLSVNSLQRVGSSMGGAFVNYSQRGSIQSLPDAALLQQNNNNKPIVTNHLTIGEIKSQKQKLTNTRSVGAATQVNSKFDTELELDSLVAELELNTYPEDTSDKRQSFPIVQSEKQSGNDMKSNTTRPTVAASVAATSRTNSMGRPRRTVASAVAAIGNAASIGTVIGPAAINAQQYKQQQRQRLSGQNVSISPIRRVTTANGAAAMLQKSNGSANADSKRRQYSKNQKSGETEGGLTPTSYQNMQQQQQQQRKFSGGSSGSGSIEKASTSSSTAAAFETINQERLKPSRVEAIQHMFEKSGGSNKEGAWPKKILHQDSGKDESLYCEISEYKKDNSKTDSLQRQRNSEKPKLRSVNIHPVFCREELTNPTRTGETHGVRFRKPAPLHINQVLTFTNAAQPPASAPPKRPPPPGSEAVRRVAAVKVPTIVTTPASNGSSEVPTTPTTKRHSRTDSLLGGTGGRLSSTSGSRAPSIHSATVDDEDDGFYDNIAADNNLSTSGLSEIDSASLSSQQLPPPAAASSHGKSGGRQLIGKLIRRIGGMATGTDGTSLDVSRPSTSAALLVSLNKVGNEGNSNHGGGGALMKSNSVSYEPWKNSVDRLSAHSSDLGAQENEKAGFGNRLKQTIFGGKRRIPAHS